MVRERLVGDRHVRGPEGVLPERGSGRAGQELKRNPVPGRVFNPHAGQKLRLVADSVGKENGVPLTQVRIHYCLIRHPPVAARAPAGPERVDELQSAFAVVGYQRVIVAHGADPVPECIRAVAVGHAVDVAELVDVHEVLVAVDSQHDSAAVGQELFDVAELDRVADVHPVPGFGAKRYGVGVGRFRRPAQKVVLVVGQVGHAGAALLADQSRAVVEARALVGAAVDLVVDESRAELVVRVGQVPVVLPVFELRAVIVAERPGDAGALPALVTDGRHLGRQVHLRQEVVREASGPGRDGLHLIGRRDLAQVLIDQAAAKGPCLNHCGGHEDAEQSKQHFLTHFVLLRFRTVWRTSDPCRLGLPRTLVFIPETRRCQVRRRT